MGPPFPDDAAKSELRAAMRRLRRDIVSDPAERARKSSVICARVIAEIGRRLVRAPRRMLAYDPLPGEPDVADLTAWAAAMDVDVFVPVVDGRDLRVGPGDIDPATLDVVVVPGLAFTVDGHRLGQGGGHFDRFLPRLAPDCLRIGVAFREQLVAEVPLEPHDFVLDAVVTDG